LEEIDIPLKKIRELILKAKEDLNRRKIEVFIDTIKEKVKGWLYFGK